jgi:hypothetical protein
MIDEEDEVQVINEYRNPQPWKAAISGFSAGATSAFVLHPLDLIKTKIQGILLYFS